MKEYLHQQKGITSNKKFTRESIIGLGEQSFRKNYYPELQAKLVELQGINARNRALITSIPDLLLVYTKEGEWTPLYSGVVQEDALIDQLMYAPIFMQELLHMVHIIQKEHKRLNVEYAYEDKHYDIRCQETETEEILIIIRDISERVRLFNQIEEVAKRDALTGIYNRWRYEQEASKYNQQEVCNLGLVIIDINGLKLINDTVGHLAGDSLIIDASKIIQTVFAERGFVSRIGGDEFGILLTDVTTDRVESMLALLSRRVVEMNQTVEPYQISLSYGYALHHEGIADMQWLFQQADNNMYQHKLLNSASAKNYLVRSLMKALEARDFITEGHADRLGEYAIKIGQTIGLSQPILNRIALLAKFHDIGKVGIPDAILKKPASLTEEEFNVMKTHTQIGERIANESGEMKEIAPFILKHHERYDGKGYPLGLAGEDIPIECRILSIVDAFDAMTNNRPYRKALSLEEAKNELLACRGTQFDPELVDIFIRLFL